MKLLLVDATNLILRFAFAKLKDLQIDHPEEVVVDVLLSAERGLQECASFTGSTHAVVVFDSDGPSWRRNVFDDYKRGRKRIEFPWSGRFTEHLTANGWHCLRVGGEEADDIIATLASRAVEKGIVVSILSSDSDLLQLLGSSCHVYQYGANGEARFCVRDNGFLLQKYGVRNGAQLAMWKALVGEPGDGLPGVAKIGKVKAAKLIQRYPTPEDLRAFGVLKSSEREQFDLMYSLVQLRENIPIDPISPSVCLIPSRENP